MVEVHEVTSYSIVVLWGPVDCIHHNGDITGYIVKYGGKIHDAGEKNYYAGLHDSTTLTIQVAAINKAGIGMYSDPLYTSGSVE